MGEKCKKCQFRAFERDANGFNTVEICAGRNTVKEALAAVKNEATDEVCNNGHEIYASRQINGVSVFDLPASQKYLTNPLYYSEQPVAECMHKKSKEKPCRMSENGHCYCRLRCIDHGCIEDPSVLLPLRRTDDSQQYEYNSYEKINYDNE